jgi:hypothetical protein
VILNSSQLPCFFYIIFAKCYFKNEFCWIVTVKLAKFLLSTCLK